MTFKKITLSITMSGRMTFRSMSLKRITLSAMTISRMKYIRATLSKMALVIIIAYFYSFKRHSLQSAEFLTLVPKFIINSHYFCFLP